VTQAWYLEPSPLLADWLGVAEVVLVREDRLPDGGGRKRRGLDAFVTTVEPGEEVHVLSYAGSHTVLTLARLLPNHRIVLYGAAYDGGPYRRAMTATLDELPNVVQHIGPSWLMLLRYGWGRLTAGANQRFMRIGGSLGRDPGTEAAAAEICRQVGADHHHIVPVASGDLLRAVQANTASVTGVLTQPPLIRVIKYLRLGRVVGLRRAPLSARIDLVRDVQALTGDLWDPIFVGSILHAVRQRSTERDRLCLWITSPSDIDWASPDSLADHSSPGR
jgi:hypothetical protein